MFGLALLALLFFCVGPVDGARAQTSSSAETGQATADLPAALQPDAIRSLTEKLSPEQVNALAELLTMVGQEGTAEAAKAAADAPNPIVQFYNLLSRMGASIQTDIVGFPTIFTGIGQAVGEFVSSRGAGGTLLFLLMTLIAVGLGIAAEFGAGRLTSNWRQSVSVVPNTDRHETLALALKSLTRRFLSETLNLIVFVVVAEIAVRFLISDPIERTLASVFIVAVLFVVRMFDAIMRFILAPGRPELRLVTLNDQGAAFLHRSFTSIAAAIALAIFFVTLLNLMGAPGGSSLRFWIGILLYVVLIAVTWRGRAALTSILIGEDEHLTQGLKRLANWWPYISIVLLVLNWAMLALLRTSGMAVTPTQGVVTIVLIVMAPFFDTLVRGIVGYLTPPMAGEGAVAERAYHRTRLSYVRIGRLVLLTTLIVILAKAWGLNLRGLAEAGFGANIAANSLEALLLLAFGYLAWELANLWINRRLAKETTDVEGADPDEPGGGEGGGTGLSRMATILPLVRAMMQATIIVIVALLFLSQLGFNIAPLLAGAGVVGLAIGFGAQTLVKDVVSGMFFLLDDAFRVGEFIVVGDTVGSVEKISIRSFQLRHPNGPVHTIPYGEIQKLTNNSRDWIIMKLKFTVPFDTDLEKVRKLFKKIGQELMEEPAIAENMIQPFKSQGVYAVDDVGIVIRGKFMTKPGHQFIIRKQIYTRVQKAFDENGIEFARKEVRVKVPGLEENRDLVDSQKRAIAAAASEAAETADTAGGGAPTDDR